MTHMQRPLLHDPAHIGIENRHINQTFADTKAFLLIFIRDNLTAPLHILDLEEVIFLMPML